MHCSISGNSCINSPLTETDSAGPSLGILTKFVSPGAVDAEKARKARLKRYYLQSVARDLAGGRVAFCLRSIAFGKDFVTVNYSDKIAKAHYGNLAVCGSVWVCPVCASKITTKRRNELKGAVLGHPELSTFMVTVTIRHSREDKLKDLRVILSNAFRRVKQGKSWMAIKARFGLVGHVSGLEVTYGQENGFHPHKHILWLSDRRLSDAELEEFKQILIARYKRALARKGRDISVDRGIELTRDADYLYSSKWGLEENSESWGVVDELTKSPVKQGRGGHYSMFQILELSDRRGFEWAKGVYKEFAVSMKGAHQLEWSKGLRARLGLAAEKTDEELANEKDQNAWLMASLRSDHWRVILANDARGELLEVAHSGDLLKLFNWLESMDIYLEHETYYSWLKLGLMGVLDANA